MAGMLGGADCPDFDLKLDKLPFVNVLRKGEALLDCALYAANAEVR
jgi:hypothetical protein